MKKITLMAAVICLSTAAFAQKYDEIKNTILLGQSAKAKELFDKSANDKFYSKPEGHIIKTSIYGTMSLDSAKMADANQNRDEAYAAFTKYREMDPSMKLLEDPVYRNAPFNLYASYYNSGVKDINDKNYDAAYEKFKRTVDLSDVLISKKIMPSAVDTNAVYYAGILAQEKHPEESIAYFTRLANLNIQGPAYEDVYKGLVRYYALKNDDSNFNKYITLGKKYYPNSDYFTYSKLDFAIGGSNNFSDKVASLEKIIAANPEDYKSNLTLAEVLYDTLNSRKVNAVRPANAAELEAKMLAALNKAASLKPEELQPILLLGDHYIAASEKIGDEVRTLERTAKTPAEKTKLAELRSQYNTNYDLARDNFEKAAAMLSKISTLDNIQKRQYRIITGNLAQYYSYKREGAKGADLNKYIALEKKYNDLYSKLK